MSIEKHLRIILDELTTEVLQGYVVSAQQNKEYDGVRVACNILLERWRKDK